MADRLMQKKRCHSERSEESCRVLRWVSPVLLLLGLLTPSAAHAADGVTYSPSPGWAGSFEQFSACGFKEGEKADLIIQDSEAGSDTVLAGCVTISYTTPIDMAPNNPLMVSIKGEQSGTVQMGPYLVVPPVTPPVIVIPPGGSGMVTGMFFAPGRTPLVLPSDGHIVGNAAWTDASGNFFAPISVLPDTPPGYYPLQIQDLPWLPLGPQVAVSVPPQPSASAQPANGGWTLNASSTLSGSGNVNVK
ncbi:MAG TPA: hypothetical protein VF157_10095, partial [Chloroflexota bacterium]